jgi:NTE family protein
MRRAAPVVKRLIENSQLNASRHKRMHIHVVQADDALKPLGASSKLNAEAAFLEANLDRINVASTVNLVETYV